MCLIVCNVRYTALHANAQAVNINLMKQSSEVTLYLALLPHIGICISSGRTSTTTATTMNDAIIMSGSCKTNQRQHGATAFQSHAEHGSVEHKVKPASSKSVGIVQALLANGSSLTVNARVFDIKVITYLFTQYLLRCHIRIQSILHFPNCM
jgi:hypothetical protein